MKTSKEAREQESKRAREQESKRAEEESRGREQESKRAREQAAKKETKLGDCYSHLTARLPDYPITRLPDRDNEVPLRCRYRRQRRPPHMTPPFEPIEPSVMIATI